VTSSADHTSSTGNERTAPIQAPWIEGAGLPPWRKRAGKALIGFAWMFGAAGLAIYAYVIWTDLPDLSHLSASREFKGGELLYLTLPLLFAFGPVWAASWLAKRIDPSRPDDASDD
jgi:hypothetical protein